MPRRKPTWSNLTAYEREKYINQDHISQGEVCLPHFENITREDEIFWGSIKFDTPARLKAIIIALHSDGMQAKEINYHLPCSLQYIHRILHEVHKLN